MIFEKRNQQKGNSQKEKQVPFHIVPLQGQSF
jgi:hypothetical protein